MRGDKLFIAQPEIGQRLYGALATAQVWEGELDQKAQLNILGEDLTLPEYWFLRGGRSLMGGALVSAAAGQLAVMQLVPNASTDSLFIVDEVTITNTTATAQPFGIGFGINAGVSLIQPVATDDGNPAVTFPGSISAAELRAGGTAVAPNIGNALQFILQANAGQITVRGPWIMRRNTPFTVRSIIAGVVTAYMSIRWRERALLDTERARF